MLHYAEYSSCETPLRCDRAMHACGRRMRKDTTLGKI